MRRKLLFGLTLLTAVLSMYAGIFGWTAVQYTLMAVSGVLAITALLTPERDGGGGGDDRTPPDARGDRRPPASR